MTAAPLVALVTTPSRRWLTAGRARRIGWTAFGVSVGFRLVGLAYLPSLGPTSVRFTLDIGLATFLAAIVLGTAAGLVGAIIVARVPGNAVGWLYVASGLGQSVASAGLAYAAVTLPLGPDNLATFMAWLNGLIDYAVPFAFAALVLALFPDGRLAARRWRVVVVLAIAGGILRILEVGFGEPSLVLLAGSVNPYQVAGLVGDLLQASSSIGAGSLLVYVAFVASAVALGDRYRGASLEGRRQIRWLLLAGVVAVASSIPFAIERIAPSTFPSNVDALSALFLGLTLVPVATLIAIARYRLYEIDRIVNRAIVYGSLTAMLAGVFTAAVGLAQRLFVTVTGQSSDAAIVLTTLVVATLYAPLRKWLEAIVERRFKYEARLGAYAHDLEAVLSLVEPREAARRLVREVVRELEATGGAVLGRDGSVLASAGNWPLDEPELPTTVTIPGMTPAFQAIVLGPRRDRRPYDPGDLADVERVAGLAARALRPAPAMPIVG